MAYAHALQDDDSDGGTPTGSRGNRSSSPEVTPSLFSRESIWLQDHSGESAAFAQDVEISGWTSVGDKKGGAYVGELQRRVMRYNVLITLSIRLLHQDEGGALSSVDCYPDSYVITTRER